MADPLASYLHDHLAGSRFALELLSSLSEQYEGEPLGTFTKEIRSEIEQDQRTLQHIIQRVGETHMDMAEMAGWLTEKAAQLKLKLDRRDQSLGTFEALETLALGIRGKLSLWKVLPLIREMDSRIPDLDFKELQESAETQYNRMEQQRLRIAPMTFSKLKVGSRS